ncbi:hypothetical protein JCM10212_004574 [Sporobolomyces blumeae]
MPPLRQLKPVLKVTLVCCILITLYRTFGRGSTSSSFTPLEQGGGGGGGGDRSTWSTQKDRVEVGVARAGSPGHGDKKGSEGVYGYGAWKRKGGGQRSDVDDGDETGQGRERERGGQEGRRLGGTKWTKDRDDGRRHEAFDAIVRGERRYTGDVDDDDDDRGTKAGRGRVGGGKAGFPPGWETDEGDDEDSVRKVPPPPRPNARKANQRPLPVVPPVPPPAEKKNKKKQKFEGDEPGVEWSRAGSGRRFDESQGVEGQQEVEAGRGRGDGDGDTFRQELEAMEARKKAKGGGEGQSDGRRPLAEAGVVDGREQRNGVDLLEGDDGEPAQAGGPRRPADEEEDDELDAVQKGDSNVREFMGRPVARKKKKGPLIQVGGAGNAQGGERQLDRVGGGRAAEGDAARGAGGAAKDKWSGKGWDQRFKKVGEKDKDKDKGATERDGEETEKDETDRSDVEQGETRPDAADALTKVASDPLLQHALVARFVERDITHVGAQLFANDESQVTFVEPDEEDQFNDDEDKEPVRRPTRPKRPVYDERHNLTVCALIPNEHRFLPEWLLYHSLLGVSRFALYDTTLPGAFGAAEIDSLADKMQDEAGGGENAPTVEELKAGVTYQNRGREGLDEKGVIRRERVRGLEEWIDKGRVRMSYMNIKNPRATHDVHALMLEHCLEKFGPTSNWLAHLDVDEFLSLSTPLYGSDEPLGNSGDSRSALSAEDSPTSDHVYPLHELLNSDSLDTAACIPLPELNYRNLGVRELKKSQGVLETQVHRDVLGEVVEGAARESRDSLPQKTLIHTAYSSDPVVTFDGPHSCKVTTTSAGGGSDAIRDSQGNVLDARDGIYESQKLPIEPLAIAHYVQRDLVDCHSKLSSVTDPLSLLPKGRGSISCEAHYLPSSAELSSPSWRNDPANADLKKVPPLGTVIEDRRMARSWAARAAKVVGDAWRREQERGMRKTSRTERDKLVTRVRHKVEVLAF